MSFYSKIVLLMVVSFSFLTATVIFNLAHYQKWLIFFAFFAGMFFWGLALRLYIKRVYTE